MLTTLTVTALVLNGLALIYVLAALGREGGRMGRTLLADARGRLLLVVLLGVFLVPFLFTLPTQAPFSHGLALGWGILIGGAIGLLVFFATVGLAAKAKTLIGAVGPLASAGLAGALAMLLFHRDPATALTGCALGAIAVALVGSGLLRTLLAERIPGAWSPLFLARGLELYGIATTVVIAAMQLGLRRFDSFSYTYDAAYWVFPAVLLGVGALALIAFSAIPSASLLERFPWLPGMAASLIMLVVTSALKVRMLPALPWKVLLTGIVAIGLTLVVLLHEERTAKVPFRPLALTFGLMLAVLVVVGLAFHWRYASFGESFALLPALVIAGALYLRAAPDEQPLTAALGMAGISFFLLFVLARLVPQTVAPAVMLNFQRQYDFFALVLGAGATLGIMSALQRWDGLRWRTPVIPITLFLVLAVLIMVGPLGILTVLGMKAFVAFLVGLTVGEIIWMALAAWSAGEERPVILANAPHSFLFAAALVALQLAPIITPKTLSRSHQALIVAVFCGFAVLWVVGDTITRVKQDTGGSDHAVA